MKFLFGWYCRWRLAKLWAQVDIDDFYAGFEGYEISDYGRLYKEKLCLINGRSLLGIIGV